MKNQSSFTYPHVVSNSFDSFIQQNILHAFILNRELMLSSFKKDSHKWVYVNNALFSQVFWSHWKVLCKNRLTSESWFTENLVIHPSSLRDSWNKQQMSDLWIKHSFELDLFNESYETDRLLATSGVLLILTRNSQ